ncbi:MAG: hypothetical protein AMXMBFR59_34490 [Rhodanobacteraceae bacterium]
MNSDAAAVEARGVSSVHMSNARLLRIYYYEAKFEFIRSLRNPGFGMPFLIMPVGLFLLFTMLSPLPEGATNAQRMYLFTGMAILGIMGPGMFGFGAILAGERQFKLLQLKQALPMPAGAHLLGKFAVALIYASATIISMVVAAELLGRISLTLPQALLVSFTLLLGVLPFCAIGLFIGARTSAHLAAGITTVVYMPQLYLSGLFFPMPPSISWIALFMPPFYLNQLVLAAGGAEHIFIGNGFVHVVVLAAFTAILAIMTVRKMARSG